MSSKPHLHFLTLPTEIRLRIYELAYSAQYINNKLTRPTGYTFHLHGSAATPPPPPPQGTPWTLLRVCRQLHHELGPLPTMPTIIFHFHNLTPHDLQTWLSRMSATQISRLRNMTFTGTGPCLQRHDGTLCERSLIVTLPDDIVSPMYKDRFDRIMNRPSTLQGTVTARQKVFYKGFFLLRVRDDVVKIPRAASHARGSIGQCNSVVDQQRALGGLITLQGELCVRAEAVVELLGAVMRGEIPGGPGTGRRLG